MSQYCVRCHNERLKTAGLALDTADPANVAEHAEVWEKVVRAARDTQDYNLERKPLVFSVFGMLAEATR